MNNSTSMRALIIEGGALRSIFSAGLLDGFLARQFNPFDFYLGVSAGACNLLGYLSASQITGPDNSPAKQPSSLDFYTSVATDSQFLNYRRFLLGGDLVNLGWLMEQVFARFADTLNQLDLRSHPLLIATTDVASGTALFTRAQPDNLYDALTATMSLPLLHRQFPKLDGRPQTDGGVAANIPIAEAIRRGASHIMMVRSRPSSYVKNDTLAHRWIRYRLRANTELVATMERRCELHREAIAQLQSPPEGVHIVDICPPVSFAAGRFSRSRDQLASGYEAGLSAADAAIDQWRQLPLPGA